MNPKEPILREEYERRHEKLRQDYATFAHRSTRILAALVVIVLANGILSTYLLHENAKRTEEITGTLVTNCKESGNPLRAATRKLGKTLIEQINGDIEQSKAFERSGTYAEFFPNISSDQLHTLLERNRKKENRTIAGLQTAVSEVAAVDCEQKFSKP